MYRKVSEPQTRFFGLVERTDIDWQTAFKKSMRSGTKVGVHEEEATKKQ